MVERKFVLHVYESHTLRVRGITSDIDMIDTDSLAGGRDPHEHHHLGSYVFELPEPYEVGLDNSGAPAIWAPFEGRFMKVDLVVPQSKDGTPKRPVLTVLIPDTVWSDNILPGSLRLCGVHWLEYYTSGCYTPTEEEWRIEWLRRAGYNDKVVPLPSVTEAFVERVKSLRKRRG